MTLTNPSLVLTFVDSGTIPVTTVSNSEIVRQSVEIDWQMMSNLKSTSDKAKISITKESVAVSRIMSFDGDIKAVLKDGDTVLFTGFLSNKYKWSVTNHGEQVLSLTIEDNTRLLETIYSDKDQLINKEFYIPARVGHPVASGVLVDIATLCGISLDASVPEIDVDIIKTVSADTECVDIIDQVCFELGYCYKFKADGKLYLWQIAKGDEPVSPTLTKDSLYAVQENAVIVNKSLKQYNRAIVKYTDISTRSNTLIYQDISGQDDTHQFCHIEVPARTAYPSGLSLDDGYTDDQLRAVCEATDLSEGKTIIGIGDTITPEFICTASGISADIRKYSANSVSVLVKNTLYVPIYIEKLQAKASITYEEGESKVYAGSVTDKKYYETSLEYVHDNDTASKLGNLIYQFYKHSNLAYTFYSKTQLALGDIIMLQENQYSGVNAKLMINAIVDSSATGIYQYVGYSFTPFNLQEGTSTNSKGYAPTVIPGPRGEKGEDGGSYRFEIYASRASFLINRRRTDYQPPIHITAELEGYDPVPTVTYTITPSTLSIDSNGNLNIEYNNAYQNIEIKASITVDSVTEERTINLSPIDETEDPQFLGCVSAVPTSLGDLNLIDGDYWCVKSTFTSSSVTYTIGDCYRKAGNTWQRIDEGSGTVTELLTCLRGFKSEGVDLGAISNQNSIVWFNQLIADSAVIGKLHAQTALFTDITVDGNSKFKGEIISDPLTTTSGSTSSGTYSSYSSASGGSFKWEDVANYITNSVSKVNGQIYTASSSTINGETASQIVYHTSLTITGTYYTIVNAQTVSTGITVPAVSYPRIYRISSVDTGFPLVPIQWQILNGSTVENEGAISSTESASATFTTIPTVPAGRTVKITSSMATVGYASQAITVRAYNSDNFDTGTNVITSNGHIYNIGRSGANSLVTYLTGYGSNLKLATSSPTSSTWVECNSSNWTSEITRYTTWASPYSTSGSGSVTSASITIKRPGETAVSYSSAQSITWTPTTLTVVINSSTTLYLTTSTSLESWSIYIRYSTTTAGMQTMAITPKEDNRFQLGSSSYKWSNIYGNSVKATSVTASSDITAGSFYGDLGGTSSSSRGNAWINTLKIYSGLTYGSTNLLTPYNFSSGCLQVPSTGSLSNFKVQYGTISITSDSTTISFGTSFSSSTTYAVAVTYVGSSYIEATPIVTARNSSYCTVKTQGRSSNTTMLWIAIGI